MIRYDGEEGHVGIFEMKKIHDLDFLMGEMMVNFEKTGEHAFFVREEWGD